MGKIKGNYAGIAVFVLFNITFLANVLGQGAATRVKRNTDQSLKIGDKVPDISFSETIGDLKNGTRFSDFKGKAVIIDFWAPWCAPCLESLPKLDSLQQKFHDKLVVLPVTSNDHQYSRTVLNNLQRQRNMKLNYSVVKDTVVTRLFKHRIIPHYIWVNKDGTVLAITGPEAITEKNVMALIGGQQIDAVVKTDKEKNYVYNEPIFAEEHLITKENLAFRSQIIRYVQGLSTASSHHKNLILCINHPVALLYKIAFGKFSLAYLSNSRIVLEGFNSEDSLVAGMYTNVTEPIFKQRWNEFLYSYELTFPDSMFTFDGKFEIMQQDLNRFFATKGITGKLEERETKVWSLIRTTKEDRMKSKENKPVAEFSRYYIKARNIPMPVLIMRIQALFPFNRSISIENNTDYKDNVDIDVSGDVTDIAVLNTNLEKYGLKLAEVTKVMPMIILTMKKK